jgi:hypothetical protein
MPVYIECPVEGCRRPAASRSRFCERHKQRNARYGSPTGKPLPSRGKRNAFEIEMQVAARYLTALRGHPSVADAVDLARALLEYKAETTVSADVRLEQALRYQRDAGADPLAVVERVIAFYLYTGRKPFATERAEAVALGRLVCHVMPLNGFRWTARVYAPCGQMARELLGRFALAVIARVRADTESLKARIARSAQL